jgi:excisionase family DNA binding protein
MATGKLLTIREAAERTGHRESTYRAWVLHRKLPVYKVGRSVRIAEADLERLIEQSRIPAREERHAT